MHHESYRWSSVKLRERKGSKREKEEPRERGGERERGKREREKERGEREILAGRSFLGLEVSLCEKADLVK